MPFENTPLPYAFDALEPYIDARTMEIHHDRHLQAYIDGLNRAIAPFPALQNCTAARLAVLNAPALRCIRPALCRNAGGVFNHRFYFAGMTPDGSRRLPCGALQSAVLQTFGTQATFVRLRLRLARPRRGRPPAHHHDRQPGHADGARPAPAAVLRRLGARLLLKAPEPPGRLCGRLAARRRLGARKRHLHRGGSVFRGLMPRIAGFSSGALFPQPYGVPSASVNRHAQQHASSETSG